jgi:hypothetical protein
MITDTILTQIVCDAATQPTVIPVVKDGVPMVVVQLKNAPHIAVLLWAIPEHGGTKYYTWLPGQQKSFKLPCACCRVHTDGVRELDDLHNLLQKGVIDKETYRRLFETYEQELFGKLKSSLVRICKDHGITDVFMRRGRNWEITDVAFGDAADLQSTVEKHLGKEAAKKELYFLRNANFLKT